jgi:hypothetical protein
MSGWALGVWLILSSCAEEHPWTLIAFALVREIRPVGPGPGHAGLTVWWIPFARPLGAIVTFLTFLRRLFVAARAWEMSS